MSKLNREQTITYDKKYNQILHIEGYEKEIPSGLFLPERISSYVYTLL